MRGRVDGLLVMSPHIDTNFFTDNLPRSLPVVVMNSRAGGAGYTSLSIDSFTGALAMVEHLVGQGFRRIAHISGPQGNRDAEERLRGFCQAVGDLLRDKDPLIIAGDFSEESGREAGRILASGQLPVDAVFAANDVMAVGCMFALIEDGVSVPADFAVAGFDDIPIARYVTPGLTTMQVHIAELGTLALETLVDAIADPGAPAKAARMLTPELVVRQSTGQPR
jgi:LacI family transcriptional regulator